jgi:hypothetical protein
VRPKETALNHAWIDLSTMTAEHVDFGVKSPTGRSIGLRITFCDGMVGTRTPSSGVYRRAPESWTTGTPVFAMMLQATRSGVNHGAAKDWKLFASAADRDIAKAKHIDSAREQAIEQAVK